VTGLVAVSSVFSVDTAGTGISAALLVAPVLLASRAATLLVDITTGSNRCGDCGCLHTCGKLFISQGQIQDVGRMTVFARESGDESPPLGPGAKPPVEGLGQVLQAGDRPNSANYTRERIKAKQSLST